jgi:hypothetical protein
LRDSLPPLDTSFDPLPSCIFLAAQTIRRLSSKRTDSSLRREKSFSQGSTFLRTDLRISKKRHSARETFFIRNGGGAERDRALELEERPKETTEAVLKFSQSLLEL